MQYRKAKSRPSCTYSVSISLTGIRELTQAHHSVHLCWSLLCHLIWFFLHHPPFFSVRYLSPGLLVLHWFFIVLWRSSSAAEASGTYWSISPVFSHDISNGEEGKAQELGEWNTYLKEKGLGRTSLCTLHSTSLCDY